jgi:hypothetical protein
VNSDVLISAAVTLLAVVIGAGLSLLSQSRAANREGAQQWRETRAGVYGRFLGAAGRRRVDDVAAALGEVQLIARYAETSMLAEALFEAVRRLAEAPEDDEALAGYRVAHQEFVDVARRELRAGERRPRG